MTEQVMGNKYPIRTPLQAGASHHRKSADVCTKVFFDFGILLKTFMQLSDVQIPFNREIVNQRRRLKLLPDCKRHTAIWQRKLDDGRRPADIQLVHLSLQQG